MSKCCGSITDLPLDIDNNFVENCEKRIIFGPNGRFEDKFVMRNFRLAPGGASALHSHVWTHLIVCLHGKGAFVVDGDDNDISAGDWLMVPGNIPHYFANKGDETFEFLCCVPPEGDVNPTKSSGNK